MKNHFRQSILVCIFISGLSYSPNVNAQKLFFLFAHAQYAIPLDTYFEHNYNYGLGVEGGLGIGTGNTFLVGTIGYTSFSPNASNGFGQLSYVPLKIGLRHYLLVGNILFFNVDAGLGIISNKISNGSRFSGDIGLGVKLGPFEVIADYDGFTRLSSESSGYSSWIGIKAGLHFGL